MLHIRTHSTKKKKGGSILAVLHSIKNQKNQHQKPINLLLSPRHTIQFSSDEKTIAGADSGPIHLVVDSIEFYSLLIEIRFADLSERLFVSLLNSGFEHETANRIGPQTRFVLFLGIGNIPRSHA